MAGLQRYVSNELTHFVGRNREDDDSRYLVFKTILSSGKLEPRGSMSIMFPGVFSTTMRGDGIFSKNEVYDTEVLCFCDIPVEDFALHMRKYSRFGLSFLKPFMIANDANPVFYVARDGEDRYPPVHARRLGKPSITRGESFDEFLKSYRSVFNELFQWVSINGPGRKDVPPKLLAALEEIMSLRSFLDYLFPYFKFFEAKQSDESESNFYMEREWRVRGVLGFGLEDVRRVILPATYARQFREDFPMFFGQITFSD